MKKLLLILLCLPMIFSCGNNKEHQIINLKAENEILKHKLYKEQKKTMQAKMFNIIQQFNIRNNYEVQLEEFDSNPCDPIDSIYIIVQKFYKIALDNNYNVILENEKAFNEISENFFKIFPILTKHYNKSAMWMNDDFECKEFMKNMDKLMQNESFEEWCFLQAFVLHLNILDKSNLYIPSYKINPNNLKTID